MKSRDFCFWLQGFFEISGSDELKLSQVEKIRKHLALVFKHEIDPSMGNEGHQADLNIIHGIHNAGIPGGIKPPKPHDDMMPPGNDFLVRC